MSEALLAAVVGVVLFLTIAGLRGLRRTGLGTRRGRVLTREDGRRGRCCYAALWFPSEPTDRGISGSHPGKELAAGTPGAP